MLTKQKKIVTKLLKLLLTATPHSHLILLYRKTLLRCLLLAARRTRLYLDVVASAAATHCIVLSRKTRDAGHISRPIALQVLIPFCFGFRNEIIIFVQALKCVYLVLYIWHWNCWVNFVINVEIKGALGRMHSQCENHIALDEIALTIIFEFAYCR